MGTCEFCGEEVDLPFQCPFCNGYFCIEHRLPENHSCINPPRRTPLGHWKAKIRKLEPKELPSLPRRTPLSSLVKCPKCNSAHTMCTAYRERFTAFVCLDCDFKWKQPGGFFPQKEEKPTKKRKFPIISLPSWFFIIMGIILWSMLDFFLREGATIKSFTSEEGLEAWLLLFNFAPLLVIGWFIIILVQILILALVSYIPYWIYRKAIKR